MDVTYYGHSCFGLRSRGASLVMDPYTAEVGWTMPKLTADIVTISHDHFDHNAADQVKGTPRRDQPMVINQPGEYEVQGISVFGFPTFHDKEQGGQRGKNTVYLIIFDGIRVCHLGDLGHLLTDELIEQLGQVDVLMVPVGGTFTLSASEAGQVISALEPGVVLPMHYHLPEHAPSFAELEPVEKFTSVYGAPRSVEQKLTIDHPVEEETYSVVLVPQLK